MPHIDDLVRESVHDLFHRSSLLTNMLQHRPGHGSFTLKSAHEMSTLIRLGTRNRSWTRPSGLRCGALARRDDAAG